jgi:hypothetical protein
MERKIMTDQKAELVKGWRNLLSICKVKVDDNLKKLKDGPEQKVVQKRGKPIIFDHVTYKSQQIIQEKLCQLMPTYSSLINSVPDLDGEWPARDYLELYLGHYDVVVEKLEKILSRGY